MMIQTLYTYSMGITALGSYALGLIVMAGNPKNYLYRAWFYFCCSVGTWAGGYFLTMLPDVSKEAALLYSRVSHASGALIPALFFNYVKTWLGFDGKRRLINYTCYGVCGILALLSLTPLIVVDLVPKLFFKYYPVGKFGYLLYVVNFIFWVVVIHCYIFGKYRSFSGQQKNQAKYFLIGTILGYLGGATCFPLIFGIQIPPYPTALIFVYVVTTTYAIRKYQLMDINIALTRAGIFIVVYAIVLGFPFVLLTFGRAWLAGILGDNWFWLPVSILFFSATFGPLFYNSLRRRAEDAILREEKRYQHKLRDISATMLLIKELDRLLRTITLKVMAMVRISWAAVYLFDEKNKLYKLMFKKIRKGTESIVFPEEFAFDSPFVTRLSKPCLPIIGEELDGTGIKVGLSVPCFINHELHGFMLLGEKLNKTVYTQDDVNVFAVLANQTALAIENCQFHLQEKYLHHAKRLESLDRQMASMAHEIDNPIQCINGNMYDVEICCNEFRSSMSPEKRQEYDSAIKQIKFNTGRISKMIGAVSAYSKADNDEVRIVGLHEILEDVYQITFAQFKTNAVTYTQDYPEDHVWLRVNKIEVEQVLVNLATNSIHAVAGKWKTGKNLPGEKKEVKLKAYKMDNGKTLRMDFSDNGYGIKKGIQEDIFLDFVTTKASTEGTGLGLSISRKLVAKYKGKIWAESEGENKGATVHVEIPIPDDITGQEIEAQKKELHEDKIRYAF